jgi:DNA-binding CsgD family transcriptional regulator
MRRSETDYKKDIQHDAHGQGDTRLATNLVLGTSMACFTATEIGYLVDIYRFGDTRSLAALLPFICALLLVYLVARFLPPASFMLTAQKVDAVMLPLSLLFGCILTYTGIQTQGLTEDISWVMITICSFVAGLLACLGLLRCYGHISEMGKQSPRSLFTVALVGGAILFIVVYWLENPVRVAMLSLLCFFGYAALCLKRRIARDFENYQSVDRQTVDMASDYPDRQPIRLNRYTHFVMFALQLALGYCIGSGVQQWTPWSASATAVLTIGACILYHLATQRLPLALGELGKIALPVCIALLFCVIPGISETNVVAAALATVFFLLLEIMNVYWLVRTSSMFSLDVARHVASGRLPLMIGAASGIALSLAVQQRVLPSSIAMEPESLRLIVSAAVAVILVTAYAFLPFNQGTPVKEGTIYSGLSSLGKPTAMARRGKPFKELCGEFSRVHGLTSREQEVLFLLACGYNAETIAQILIISTSTARTHVYRIYQKTGIHSQQELLLKLDSRFTKADNKRGEDT